MRLIDANALIWNFGEVDDNGAKRWDFFVTADEMREVSTVDAVPVTRCKDCVHAFPADTPHTCTRSEMRIKAYGFCAWATKRRNTDDK